MKNEDTIGKDEIAHLHERIARLTNKLNNRSVSTGVARHLVGETFHVNLTEAAVLDVALSHLLRSMEQQKQST